MSLSAKIVLNIPDTNGRSDNQPSANDCSKIEILKREGPAGAGGSFAIVKTFSSSELTAGQSSYVFEDTDIEIKTPYYYVTRYYRDSDFVDSPELGPVFIAGLHELAYPNNVPSDSDGVPNFISVAPLLHLNAEYEYNFYGQQSGRSYATDGSEIITNQNELYPGLGWKPNGNSSIETTAYNIPYINLWGYAGNQASNNPSEAFSSLKSNLGIDPDAQLIAMDEGFTVVLVATYQELQGSKRIHQDQYAHLAWNGLYNQTLPTEWDVSGGINTQKSSTKFGYTETNIYHPRRVSDGGFYEPQNIGNYFGPPNGVYWPEAKGYWGHRSQNIHSVHQLTNLDDSHTLGGISSWGRSDYNQIYTNQVTKASTTTNIFPTGSDTDKVCVLIWRFKEDGSGSQKFINGNLFSTSEHHQQIFAENAGGHDDYNISGTSTGEPTWWEAQGHATDFGYLDTAHSPSTSSTPFQGYRYHIPPMVNSGGFGQMLRLNSDSRMGICELMAIPSSLTDSDFRRLTTYIANKYEDNMLPQGDYSL